ncbi:MAG: hypothetical protein JSR85_06215 [Proteobacteria bacterium]|nr:hypothetical protein [Pseudomonadota bacterium]
METVSIVGSVDVPGDKIMDDQRVDMVSTNDSSDVTWGDFVVSGSVVLRIIPNDKNAIYQRLREYGFWDIRDTPELRTIEKLNALVWRVTCDPDATWNSFWLRCSLKLIHQEKQEGATEGS